jgi:tripartite-type tricarboxylate transporter receptor subunit TctC
VQKFPVAAILQEFHVKWRETAHVPALLNTRRANLHAWHGSLQLHDGIAILLDKNRRQPFIYLSSVSTQGKSMRSPRRSILALILCGFAALVSTAAPSPAQTPAWPQRPVRFVIPLGPGAGADIVARLFGDRLSAKWGQTVVVENKPGGDAFVAITAVINAHDDHVLLFAPASTYTAHPYLHDKLSYNINDLVPIARVTNTLIGLGVATSLGVSTLPEFIAKVKAEPGKLNYASVTGANDLLFVGFLHSEKLIMSKVPYRDPVQAINDLSEGRIHAFVSAYAILRPQVLNGKVKVLALTNSQGTPALPDLKPAAQLGYPSLTFEGLIGISGPKDMPPAVRERIAADIRDIAAADPALPARLATIGQVLNPGSPQEFAAALADQRVTVKKIGDMLGMKAAE